jgi:hypothetical protein
MILTTVASMLDRWADIVREGSENPSLRTAGKELERLLELHHPVFLAAAGGDEHAMGQLLPLFEFARNFTAPAAAQSRFSRVTNALGPISADELGIGPLTIEQLEKMPKRQWQSVLMRLAILIRNRVGLAASFLRRMLGAAWRWVVARPTLPRPSSRQQTIRAIAPVDLRVVASPCVPTGPPVMTVALLEGSVTVPLAA